MSMATAKFVCLILGCAGTTVTQYGLRRHFHFLHPQDLVNVPGEGCYPSCNCCGMQVNPMVTRHQGTKSCRAIHAAKLQQKVVSNSTAALDEKFYVYREELERVEVFKYL